MSSHKDTEPATENDPTSILRPSYVELTSASRLSTWNDAGSIRERLLTGTEDPSNRIQNKNIIKIDKELRSRINEVVGIMTQVETCSGCNGKGFVACPICQGAGRIRKRISPRPDSYLPEKVECQHCQGTGRLLCKLCEGVGKIFPDKTGSSKS